MSEKEIVAQYFDMKNRILGYGNPDDRVWFVGIEDGWRTKENEGAATHRRRLRCRLFL
ncbi:MAG: hypothetical protein WCL44_10645 [bacterium]